MTPFVIAALVGWGLLTLVTVRAPFRRALWAVLLASGTILFSLARHRADFDRYRISLLGYRFAVTDTLDRPILRELSAGGPREAVDLYVPGTEREPAGYVRIEGADSLRRALAAPAEDGSGVLLVRHDREPWRIVGGSPFGEGDTVLVRRASDVLRVTARTSRDLLLRIRHDLEVDTIEGLASVRLPLMSDTRPWGFGRSMFRRSFPLADILDLAVPEPGRTWGPLGSFFYYDDNTLHFVEIDSEVEVAGAPGGWRPEPIAVWEPDGPTVRLRPAALPLRDYPELDLTLPERYGVRPLMSFRVIRRGRWLDLYLEEAEAYALTRAELEALHESSDDRARADDYRIRLNAATPSTLRRALTFRLPADRFAVTSAAVLELPRRAGGRQLGVLTPGGFAQERLGRPFPIGEPAGRSLVVRVDRQAVTLRLLAGIATILLLTILTFAFADWVTADPARARLPALRGIAAIGLGAFGLLCVRLFPSLAALANPPFSDESYQMALWLLPTVPWLVTVAGLTAVSFRLRVTLGRGPAWGLTAIGVVLVGLTAIVFPVGRARILSLVPIAAAAFWAAVMLWGRGRELALRGWRRATARSPVRRITAWFRRDPVTPGLRWIGFSLGLALLAVRTALWWAGSREAVQLGERVALSVFYTPAVVLALAAILVVHGRAIRATATARAWRRELACLFLDLGLFILLALGLTALMIGDFGLALTALPGILLLLFLLLTMALRRGLGTAPGPQRRTALVGITLPLAVFIALHIDPSAFPRYPDTAVAEDRRVQAWERDELLLLERGDPGALRLIGQRRSEALGVMRETMQAYTRGDWRGSGFFQGRVSDELRRTATREHMVSALLVSEWGFPGAAALLLLLLALPFALDGFSVSEPGRLALRDLWLPFVLLVSIPFSLRLTPAPVARPLVFGTAILAAAWLIWTAFRRLDASEGDAADRVACWPAPSAGWLIAAQSLFLFSFAGVYMLLANYGWVLFTGKNVYLFGLDSVSDAIESIALLLIAAVALGSQVPRPSGRRPSPGAA